MPHVQITWVEGRSPEQKRKIAERVTATLIEDGKAKRENIHVSFHDVPSTNYAEAGVLVVAARSTMRAISFDRMASLWCCIGEE
jgi:4-oxalocrotonate tautomerase